MPTVRDYIGKVSLVAAKHAIYCTWQVTVGTSTTPLVPAWAPGVNKVIGQVVTNDTPLRMYRCIDPGTTDVSGGPTGTATDITDAGAHWAYVEEFQGGFEITNMDAVNAIYVSPSSGGTIGTGDGVPREQSKEFPFTDPSQFHLIGAAANLQVTVRARL
jgi:hypothetical protein